MRGKRDLYFWNFFLNPELEGLLIATVKPRGNKVKPRIGTDLRKGLQRFLRKDALNQIDQAIYPDREVKEDRLTGRITPKKLRRLQIKRIAKALDVSYEKVRRLWNEDQKTMRPLIRYIKSSSKRDAILLAFEKNKI